ncbi:MAG: helix-turn-helix transcriptional regulator [Parcubacteria group bacterium]|jgi:transcriptional regulator with XRE-family HTH domain
MTKTLNSQLKVGRSFMRRTLTENEINQYKFSDKNYAYFEKKYKVVKKDLIRLICLIEELDDLIIRRKMNVLTWEPIGEGISHITQMAKKIGLNNCTLMKFIPDLERFNENLKERSFGMFVKKYRRIFGLTAKELSTKTKISLNFINSVESGIHFPIPNKANAIAKILNLNGEAKRIYFQIYRKERGLRSLTSRFEPSEKRGLGFILRQIRISGGWSQAELSKKNIISICGLCKIERGKHPPSEKSLRKLVKFYKLPKDDLVNMLDLLCRIKGAPNQIICKDNVGKMLKSLRKREGISQGFLAEQLGVNFSLVSFWESNKRFINLKYIDGITKILNLSEQEKEELLIKIDKD